MPLYRSEIQGLERSPQREIYGIKNGHLVAPFDICIYEFNKPNNIANNALSLIHNADVKNVAGSIIGTIKSFDSPLNNNFKPVVFIELKQGVKVTSTVRKIEPSTVAKENEVSKGVMVHITRNNGRVIRGGTILEIIIVKRSYILPNWEIEVYRVKFQQTLGNELHGAPVILDNSHKLLGMLIITEDNYMNGTTECFVFPADRL